MKINLTLYTTKLSPTDTLYFDTQRAQQDYFNSLPQVGYYPNLSYNGTRNIRLTGVVPYLLTTTPANYAKIDYLSENEGEVKATHFCFIDNIIYVNNNNYEIELTIDYLQTFMFSPLEVFGDYAIVAENRKFTNTLKRSYGNTMPVAVMREDVVYNARQEYNSSIEFAYAVATIKSTDLDEFNKSLNTGLASYVFPAVITKQDPAQGGTTRIPTKIELLPKIFILQNGAWVSGLAPTLLLQDKTISPNVVGITINDDIGLKNRYTFSTEAPPTTWMGDETIWIKVNESDPANSEVYLSPSWLFKLTGANSKSGLVYHTTLDTPKNGYPVFYNTPTRSFNNLGGGSSHILQREPYSWLEFRVRGQQAQRISFVDSKNMWESGIEEGDSMGLSFSFNPLYPNTTTYYLADGGSINEVFSIAPSITNLAFSVDQWAQYYVSHQASVNDGLATKHSYDMEIANRNLNTQVAQAGLSMTAGVAGAFATGNVARGVSAISSGTGQLVGSLVAYENTKTNIEKENALLELSYQDLKSAPSNVNNQELNQNSFASMLGGGMKIVLISPNFSEYNTIMRYHTIYGFRVEEYTNTQEKFNSNNVALRTFLKPSTDTALNGYRYICVKDVKLQNGMTSICQIISRILENGLKIWNSPADLETSNYPYETGYTATNTPLSRFRLFRI